MAIAAMQQKKQSAFANATKSSATPLLNHFSNYFFGVVIVGPFQTIFLPDWVIPVTTSLYLTPFAPISEVVRVFPAFAVTVLVIVFPFVGFIAIVYLVI